MKTKLVVILLGLIFFSGGCSHSIVPNPLPPDIVMTQKSLSLVSAGNSFTFNLLNKIPNSQGHNVMVFPRSISLAFSIALNGADGTTIRAIIQSLGIKG